MIGDSIMSVKPERALPENGWGMALEKHLADNAEIKNHARNGRSSKSFINEGLWAKVYEEISRGDFVIIQFGHNDEKINDTSRYTIPKTTFKENLRKFIIETRMKGGTPILCTPVVRRKFNKEEKLVDTHGDYPDAIRDIAAEMKVTFVDLNKLTAEKISELGPEKSKSIFMILAPGEHLNFPEGKEDNTHLQEKGAAMVAELFITEIKKQQVGLAALFK